MSWPPKNLKPVPMPEPPDSWDEHRSEEHWPTPTFEEGKGMQLYKKPKKKKRKAKKPVTYNY